ncbi:MAG: nitroreductase family protein [Chlorobium sp.]|nr:MAG: nitroreductase family protein [Chlorobium sp.]
MLFRELVTQSRSCRRFDATFPVTEDEVRNLVELACYVPSAKNLQPLKFILVCDPPAVSALFPLLSWAGYLSDWSGPEEDERPRAFIIMLGDQRISQDFACDSGIAAQTILLGATASGLGGCIVASLDRAKIRELFNIPESFSILMVIALGKPAETIVIDQMEADASVRYFRDAHGIHHVPKRVLEELLVKFH